MPLAPTSQAIDLVGDDEKFTSVSLDRGSDAPPAVNAKSTPSDETFGQIVSSYTSKDRASKDVSVLDLV